MNAHFRDGNNVESAHALALQGRALHCHYTIAGSSMLLLFMVHD